MARVAEIPPVIKPKTRRFGPGLFLAGVIGAMLVARLSQELNITIPKCSFKNLTGLPCATCGSTRALRALSHGQLSEAFWWNPAATLAVLGGIAAFLFWLVAPRDMVEKTTLVLRRLPIFAIIITLLGL